MFKEQTNPIGEVFYDEGIDKFVAYMAAKWEEDKVTYPWWQFWKRISFVKVTNFLLQSLEYIVSYVDDFVDKSGADKKATVLDAISRLYDYVVKEAMPLWMKPFAKSIKNYIIYEVISAAIDWLVERYHSGEWKKKDAKMMLSMWS